MGRQEDMKTTRNVRRKTKIQEDRMTGIQENTRTGRQIRKNKKYSQAR